MFMNSQLTLWYYHWRLLCYPLQNMRLIEMTLRLTEKRLTYTTANHNHILNPM